MDPERVHYLAIAALETISRFPWLLNLVPRLSDQRLVKEVFGIRFPNPIGLAAGFDKNGVALPAWEALGFGFVEIGTITAQGQPGNPVPRIFRIPEMEALINRLGFNNEGAEKIGVRLERLRQSSRWPKIPVGINIGKTKVVPFEEATLDYVRVLPTFARARRLFRSQREFAEHARIAQAAGEGSDRWTFPGNPATEPWKAAVGQDSARPKS